MFYSPATHGFYDPLLNNIIPPDSISITDNKYRELLYGGAEGKQIFINELGEPFLASPPGPANLYTTDDGIVWTMNVAAAKRYLMDKVQTEKNRAKGGGFMLDGVLFDSDDAAQIAYLQFRVKLSSNPDYSTQWKASNGVWVTMDATLFEEIIQAIEEHVAQCFAWQAAKEMEIAACTTAAEIEAVSLVFGE